MKIKGEFVLREIGDDTILVPVGETALRMNAMITLDPVAALIWRALEQDKNREDIVAQIIKRFDVTEETARKDLDEFLEQMRKADLFQ